MEMLVPTRALDVRPDRQHLDGGGVAQRRERQMPVSSRAPQADARNPRRLLCRPSTPAPVDFVIGHERFLRRGYDDGGRGEVRQLEAAQQQGVACRARARAWRGARLLGRRAG